jgi:transglutaminase-like putative cysteine protease
MTQKPYVNLGSGKVHLPAAQPAHHALVEAAIYDYPEWVNVDISANVGADQVVNLFEYPWGLPDNSFDAALLSHLVEHIPHGTGALDGFYAFFAELYRVLTPRAVAHVLVPYGRSTGAFQDPTHHRYILPETFTYLTPNPDAPFAMDYGSAWEIVDVRYGLTPLAGAFAGDQVTLQRALETQFNIASDLYVKLRSLKPE